MLKQDIKKYDLVRVAFPDGRVFDAEAQHDINIGSSESLTIKRGVLFPTEETINMNECEVALSPMHRDSPEDTINKMEF